MDFARWPSFVWEGTGVPYRLTRQLRTPTAGHTRFPASACPPRRIVQRPFFRDEVRADPGRWLGSDAHSAPELAVPLVKLLDAGQRLPVHVHPSDACARKLGVWPQGKAEAWFVIDAPASAVVHVGWSRAVTATELAGWVEEQDVTAMLGAMHALQVAPGDSVYVPPGTPHAIGARIFLVSGRSKRSATAEASA